MTKTSLADRIIKIRHDDPSSMSTPSSNSTSLTDVRSTKSIQNGDINPAIDVVNYKLNLIRKRKRLRQQKLLEEETLETEISRETYEQEDDILTEDMKLGIERFRRENYRNPYTQYNPRARVVYGDSSSVCEKRRSSSYTSRPLSDVIKKTNRTIDSQHGNAEQNEVDHITDDLQNINNSENVSSNRMISINSNCEEVKDEEIKHVTKVTITPRKARRIETPGDDDWNSENEQWPSTMIKDEELVIVNDQEYKGIEKLCKEKPEDSISIKGHNELNDLNKDEGGERNTKDIDEQNNNCAIQSVKPFYEIESGKLTVQNQTYGQDEVSINRSQEVLASMSDDTSNQNIMEEDKCNLSTLTSSKNIESSFHKNPDINFDAKPCTPDKNEMEALSEPALETKQLAVTMSEGNEKTKQGLVDDERIDNGVSDKSLKKQKRSATNANRNATSSKSVSKTTKGNQLTNVSSKSIPSHRNNVSNQNMNKPSKADIETPKKSVKQAKSTFIAKKYKTGNKPIKSGESSPVRNKKVKINDSNQQNSLTKTETQKESNEITGTNKPFENSEAESNVKVIERQHICEENNNGNTKRSFSPLDRTSKEANKPDDVESDNKMKNREIKNNTEGNSGKDKVITEGHTGEDTTITDGHTGEDTTNTEGHTGKSKAITEGHTGENKAITDGNSGEDKDITEAHTGENKDIKDKHQEKQVEHTKTVTGLQAFDENELKVRKSKHTENGNQNRKTSNDNCSLTSVYYGKKHAEAEDKPKLYNGIKSDVNCGASNYESKGEITGKIHENSSSQKRADTNQNKAQNSNESKQSGSKVDFSKSKDTSKAEKIIKNEKDVKIKRQDSHFKKLLEDYVKNVHEETDYSEQVIGAIAKWRESVGLQRSKKLYEESIKSVEKRKDTLEINSKILKTRKRKDVINRNNESPEESSTEHDEDKRSSCDESNNGIVKAVEKSFSSVLNEDMKTDKENEDRQHECGVKIDIHKEDGKQDENIPCGAYSNEGLETMDSDQVDYAQSESKSQTQIRIEEDTNNHSQFPMVENTLDPKTGDEESLRTTASDENLESYNSNTSNDINDERPRHAKLKLPKHNHSNLHSTSDSKLPENNELPPLSRIKRSFTRLQHIPFNDREYDIKDDDEYKLGDGTLLFEENQKIIHTSRVDDIIMELYFAQKADYTNHKRDRLTYQYFDTNTNFARSTTKVTTKEFLLDRQNTIDIKFADTLKKIDLNKRRENTFMFPSSPRIQCRKLKAYSNLQKKLSYALKQ